MQIDLQLNVKSFVSTVLALASFPVVSTSTSTAIF